MGQAALRRRMLPEQLNYISYGLKKQDQESSTDLICWSSMVMIEMK
jgi:hypothetical protein